ncbi:MAG: ABC transporter permease subunit [Proteobacteria bacterium]|nr:ABC transporter permease subunit [Pseudomonadota bacterium]
MNRAQTGRLIAEAAVLIGLACLVVATGYSIRESLVSRNIATGFGFLAQDTGWDVSAALLAHSPRDTYARTFLIGLLNTLALSLATIIVATVLGVLIALVRQLQNPLLSWLIGGYVTILRNVPLIVQIFFWYGATQGLPNTRKAFELSGGVFLSNRGLYLPSVKLGWPEYAMLAVLVVSIVISLIWRHRPRRLASGLALVAVAVWLVGPALFDLPPLAVDWPRRAGLNFAGGMSLQPELVAVLTALVVYNTAFIAEIVRTGVQSVPLGQIQAAQNIGLRQSRIFYKIILPQAVRVMVLPLINQYSNITKATALAMVVGFTDLFSVSVTSINHTGQALEIVLLMTMLYFAINATISLVGNTYAYFDRRRWKR